MVRSSAHRLLKMISSCFSLAILALSSMWLLPRNFSKISFISGSSMITVNWLKIN